MSNNWMVALENGRTWFVGAFSIFGEPKHYPDSSSSAKCGEIIIPVCQLDGMTVQEIGEQVLAMAPTARTCFAAHVASAYVGSEKDYQRRAPNDIVESMVFKDLPLLEAHRKDDHADARLFDEAIDFLREMKSRYKAAQLRKKFKVHPARKEVSGNYDALFMAIGRRDGFHCGACSTTRNLQIDHVKPVSIGGLSDIENLQLLCGSCNSKKGDKTVDYREVAA